jgi:hypothetical protein
LAGGRERGRIEELKDSQASQWILDLPERSYGSKISSPLFSVHSHFGTQEEEGAEDPKWISILAETIVALWPFSAQYMTQLFSRITPYQEM